MTLMREADVIDLRSDTVTKPTPAMLEAVRNATFGDHGYLEDETTLELEGECANLFSKEAALFLPSGTMANQVALRCHTIPGDEIILEHNYHINYFEAGPTADLAKVYPNVIITNDGILRAEDIEEALFNKSRTKVGSQAKLVCLENTINSCGGRIFPLETMAQVFALTRQAELAVHLDGARILNACAATGIEPSSYACYTDSLTLCFSKGLGAPFGSILIGTRELIEKARRYCKWYGGGMHQSGFMAAAALHALRHHRHQLACDNRHAKYLAELLAGLNLLGIDPAGVETNIVLMDTQQMSVSSTAFSELAKAKGVLLYPWSRTIVRAVTHRDVTHPDIEEAGRRLRDVVGALHERCQ